MKAVKAKTGPGSAIRGFKSPAQASWSASRRSLAGVGFVHHDSEDQYQLSVGSGRENSMQTSPDHKSCIGFRRVPVWVSDHFHFGLKVSNYGCN